MTTNHGWQPIETFYNSAQAKPSLEKGSYGGQGVESDWVLVTDGKVVAAAYYATVYFDHNGPFWVTSHHRSEWEPIEFAPTHWQRFCDVDIHDPIGLTKSRKYRGFGQPPQSLERAYMEACKQEKIPDGW